jgi:hypothetical protein
MVLLCNYTNGDSHLVSFDLDELHEFAKQLPAEHVKFEDAPKPNIPIYKFHHWGISQIAKQLGAEEVDSRTMASFYAEFNKHRED